MRHWPQLRSQDDFEISPMITMIKLVNAAVIYTFSLSSVLLRDFLFSRSTALNTKIKEIAIFGVR